MHLSRWHEKGRKKLACNELSGSKVTARTSQPLSSLFVSPGIGRQHGTSPLPITAEVPWPVSVRTPDRKAVQKQVR